MAITFLSLKHRDKFLYDNIIIVLYSPFWTLYVCNILNYGCEVWGSHWGPDIERSTMSFYGMYWEFVKNTNTSMVYFETSFVFFEFRFWFKIMQSENCILRASYECVYRMCENSKEYMYCSSWMSFIKEQLHVDTKFQKRHSYYLGNISFCTSPNIFYI